jgi:hypothetical protein
MPSLPRKPAKPPDNFLRPPHFVNDGCFLQGTGCYRQRKDCGSADRNWDQADLKSGITPWFAGTISCTLAPP